MPTVVDAIALALIRLGVTQIFGQSLPSAIALAAQDVGITQVMYRTENAGGAIADGFAKISGRIGVVAAQNGPAATLLPAPCRGDAHFHAGARSCSGRADTCRNWRRFRWPRPIWAKAQCALRRSIGTCSRGKPMGIWSPNRGRSGARRGPQHYLTLVK